MEYTQSKFSASTNNIHCYLLHPYLHPSAICTNGTVFPQVRKIAMTLKGPGFNNTEQIKVTKQNPQTTEKQITV